MPIKEKVKNIIDFEYEENNLYYRIRYHDTEKFGKTISLSLDGKTWSAHYPLDLFVQIVSFLSKKHVVDKFSIPIEGKVEASNLGGDLQLPVIDSLKGYSGLNQNSYDLPSVIPSVPKTETDETEVDESVPEEAKEVLKTEVEETSDELKIAAEKMKAQRALAVAKAKDKKITKLDPVEDPNAKV